MTGNENLRISTACAYEFLRRETGSHGVGTFCGLVFSVGVLGVMGWGLHHWLALGWELFAPTPLTLLLVLAGFYPFSYWVGAVTANHQQDHSSRRRGAETDSDDSTGEDLGWGCALAVLQFVFGSFHQSLSYFLQGGVVPDHVLRLAAAILSLVSHHGGLTTSDLQQALEATGSRIVAEDFRAAMRLLRAEGHLVDSGNWSISSETTSALRSGS